MSTSIQDGPKAALPAGLEREARLNMHQLEALTGWRKSKIYLEIAAGRFPPPERRGLRCSRWVAGHVIDHMKVSS